MGDSYYLFSSGELKRKDNTLQFIKPTGEKRNLPIEVIYDIYAFGEITINSKLINFLSQTGICVHFYKKRVSLAKKFVYGATENILRNLKYYNVRGRDLNEEIESITKLEESLDSYNRIDEIMGIEGNVHRIYYRSWNKIINQEIDFEKRVKRPPDNMINSLISFLNSVLYTKILSEIYRTQLNPTISYLHEPSVKRFSLSLDVAEIFKPLIVDRLIFYLLNKNIISENDFDKESNFLRLKENVLQNIMGEVEKRLKTTIKHRTLNRDVSYRYLIRLELYKIIKHLLGEKEYSPFKIWW
ncbi:MAG: type I-B CRISPR-associated endonuclease Cas1 [Brachyspira sp.]|nr:type I-B CRISPR-associated endonuclease Cas1 [Brachyspira sp.]